MGAGGVIWLFIWKTARALPEEIYVCLFPSVSKKVKKKKGREGVHGGFFLGGGVQLVLKGNILRRGLLCVSR